MSTLSRIARAAGRLPVIGPLLMVPYRARGALPHALRPLGQMIRFLVRSREHTNYTYHLEDLNYRYLAAFVAHVTGISHATALGYMNELQDDEELRAHIRKGVRASDDGRFADEDTRYGRRLGWYAIARAVKPRVVVETGVDKGLGACVLTAALRRNAQDGTAGYYYGTDINPAKGYLLSGEYARFGRVLYGDSITLLAALDERIDLFVNDSDHSAEYEAREYETIASKLSPAALVLGDNADLTDELLRFAERTGRKFLYFREEPRDHWFPGGGIGVAWHG